MGMSTASNVVIGCGRPHFDDFEVVLGQSADWIAVLVGDDRIDLNRAHASAERGNRFLRFACFGFAFS